jgi:hypothetical protein
LNHRRRENSIVSFWQRKLSSGRSSKKNISAKRTRSRRRLLGEMLEARRLLTTYVVDSLLDTVDGNDNVTTLREAVNAANGNADADTITFDASLAYGTIELATIDNTEYGNSALTITSEITIDGSAAPFLTIGRSSSQSNLRQFYISTTGDLTLDSVTVSGGQITGGSGGSGSGFNGGGGSGGGGAGLGGAIYNRGELTIVDSTLNHNSATGGFSGVPVATGFAGAGGGGMAGNGFLAAGSNPGTGGAGGGGSGGAPQTAGNAGTYGGGGGGGGRGSTGNAGAGGAGGFGGGGGGGGGSSGSNAVGAAGVGGFGGGNGAVGQNLSFAVYTGGRGGGGAGFGGAIFNDDATVAIINSTLTDNSAQGGVGANNGMGGGGAVFSRGGTVNISNSTIDANYASSTGGAVYIYQAAGTATDLTVNSSILADSTGGTHDFVATAGGGSISTHGDSNIVTSHNSGSLSSLVTYQAPPDLAPLADNGGPTMTMMPANDSNAIGSGTNPLSLTTDQIGNPRLTNGVVDIGAIQWFVIPSITSIARQTPSTQLTNAASVTFALTFDEDVTGVDTSQIELTGTAAGACSVSQVTGSGSSYQVTVDVSSANGTLGLTVKQGVIENAYGFLYAGQIDSSQTYTLDHAAPTITSILRTTPTAEITNANSVTWTITFDVDVTGVDSNTISVGGPGATAAGTPQITAVNDHTYTVTVDTTNSSGAIGVVVSTSGITDAVGNTFDGTIGTTEIYQIDHTAPIVATITRGTPSGAMTNANSVTYNVEFNEAVTGVQLSNFSLTGAGASGSSVSSFSGSETSYSVVVNTTNANGILNLQVSGTNIIDAAGNGFTGTISSQQAYDVSHLPPVVTSIVRTTPTSQTTNAGSVVFTVTFNRAVANMSTSNVQLTGTAAADASITQQQGNGVVFTITVNTATANGTLGLNLLTGQIIDGYANLYAGTIETSESYILDHVSTPPVVTSPAAPVMITTNQYTISGTSEAGSLVRLMRGATLVGTQQLGSTETNFSFDAEIPLGENNFIVAAQDTLLNPAASTAVPTITRANIVAVGTNAGSKSQPIVNVYNASTAELLSSLMPYGATFKGGVRVATGDLTGDGLDEIIVSPASKMQAQIKVYSIDGEELTNLGFMASGPKEKKGAVVTVADVDGDGWNDIVTSATTGRSYVKVFKNDYANHPEQAFSSTPMAQFEAFTKKYKSGVSLSAGDVNDDGADDIIVGSNKGGVSQIAVFTMADPNVPTFTQLVSFQPFGAKFKGGVSVSAGDIDGDGDADITGGAGAKGNSLIQAFNGQTGATLGGSFTAFPANIKLPVNVAAKDLDGDDIIDEIFAALGSASANVPIKRYLPNGQPSPQGVDFVLETDKAFSYGIQLA